MSCKKYERLIYAADRLNGAQTDALAVHTRLCAECEREYAAFRRMAKELKALNCAAPADGLNAFVMSRVTGARGAAGGTRGFKFISLPAFKPLAAAFCGVAALAVLLSFIGLSLTGAPQSAANGGAGASFASPPLTQGDSGKSAAGSAQTAGGAIAGDINADATFGKPESGPSARSGAAAPAAENVSAPAAVPDIFKTEKILKTVNISISTDNIAETARIIKTLPGVTVNSSLNYQSSEESKLYGTGYAERRVSMSELEYLRLVLRTLGNVTYEDESQTYYTSEYDELAVKTRNARDEISAVSVFIGKSSHLDDIFYIEGRISEIDRQLDGYLGRMRQIADITKDARVYITFSAYPDGDAPPLQTPPFSERVKNAFAASLNFTKNMFEGLALFFAAVAAPLAVMAAIAAAVMLVVKKRSAKP